MSLTMGTAPFGHVRVGAFNTEVPRRGVLYFEPSPRRIRGVFAGETVVGSSRVHLMHEHGQLPRRYFPFDDVRMDLLVPSKHSTSSPLKGDAIYWHLRVGDRTYENAAWSYPKPPEGAPALQDFIAFYVAAMDEWLEEDEPVYGHARDPYHRIDVLQTSRHVQVSLDGMLLAESRRARALFETGLPTRWYLPLEDVRVDLIPSELKTMCTYKGHASYHSVRIGDELQENVAWTYREPWREAERVAGYVAFFNERVDLVVDGEPQPRMPSPWSARNWWRDNEKFALQM